MTVVLTRSKKTTTTLEDLLAKEHDEGYVESNVGMVSEMLTEARQLRSFGFSDAIQARGQQLAEDADDDSPEFVVVRTEAGRSRSGRIYPDDLLVSIAEQVNFKQPVGYLGHIKDEDLDTALPEPQTTWFGAVTRTEPSEDKAQNGKSVTVIYTAGYLLPDAKIKRYIKTKAVNSTSWQGLGTQTPIPGQGVRVSALDLHSIDWSRKGAEGMPTARVVAMAREMSTGDNNKGGTTKMEGDGKSLAEVTPEEFKAENPNGYTLLVREISQAKDGEIADLTTQVEEAKADKTLLDEIRGVLKLTVNDDVLAQIASLVKKLGERAKVSVEEALDKVLAEKVPDEDRRKVVKRLALVSEMTAKAEQLPEDSTADDVEKVVREMVDHQFDSDEVVQGIVSEMAPPIIGRAEQLRSGSKVDYGKLGMVKEVKSL